MKISEKYLRVPYCVRQTGSIELLQNLSVTPNSTSTSKIGTG